MCPLEKIKSAKLAISNLALLIPCMEFETFKGPNTNSFEVPTYFRYQMSDATLVSTSKAVTPQLFYLCWVFVP